MATIHRSSAPWVDGGDLDGGQGPAQVQQVALDGLQADWRALRFVRLPVGSSWGPRRLVDSEVIVFVTSGTVTAILAGGAADEAHSRELSERSVLALPWGGVLHVENRGGQPAEMVVAELGAP